jgi:ribosomal protein L32
MSVRMRHTRGHTGNRRSHHALKNTKIVKDVVTGNFRLPHRIDEISGTYRGNQIADAMVIKTKEKKARDGSHHEHAHSQIPVTAKQEEKGASGIVGKIAEATRPRSRSGMGGQA